jgi:hypothetical protein
MIVSPALIVVTAVVHPDEPASKSSSSSLTVMVSGRPPWAGLLKHGVGVLTPVQGRYFSQNPCAGSIC